MPVRTPPPDEAALAARNALVEAHVGLVHAVAHRCSVAPGLEYEDLVQEGMMGLIRAAELFDPGQGVAFSTYATLWIKQGILRALKTNRLIALPINAAADVAELPIAREPLSLEMPVGQERDTPLRDLIPDDQAEDEGAILRRVHLEQLMARLPEGLRRVIELRYWGEMTLRQAAEQLGVTKEAVRLRQGKALLQLRAVWEWDGQ
jgi:RNA polymerase primary sigma factor